MYVGTVENGLCDYFALQPGHNEGIYAKITGYCDYFAPVPRHLQYPFSTVPLFRRHKDKNDTDLFRGPLKNITNAIDKRSSVARNFVR